MVYHRERAEGAAKARLLAAHAEAEAITRISSDATTSPAQIATDFTDSAQYLIVSRYIEGLRDMAISNNTQVVFMPTQTSRV